MRVSPDQPVFTGDVTVAKLYAYWATRNYREAYDTYAVNGILFNHESPRRGEPSVTRKVTRAVARIKAGLQDKLFMGNLDAVRDWGYAPEYVEGMWRMLQASEPTDYVLATNTAYSVKDFARLSFDHAGLDGENHLAYEQRYERPTEVDALIADYTTTRANIGRETNILPPNSPASWSTRHNSMTNLAAAASAQTHDTSQ